jgi:hypothetical protein
MNLAMCSFGAVLLMTSAARAQDLAGDWQGTIQGADRRVVVLVAGERAVGWSATLFSIDQSSHGIPGDGLTMRGRDVRMTFGKVSARYEATLSEDGETLSGQWTSGERALQLDLHKTTRDRLWVRCIEPQRIECHRLPGDTHATGL